MTWCPGKKNQIYYISFKSYPIVPSCGWDSVLFSSILYVLLCCYVWGYLIWWYSVSRFSRCVPLKWSEETLNLEEISELPPMFGREHRPVKSLQFQMNLDVIVHEFTFWLEMQTSSFFSTGKGGKGSEISQFALNFAEVAQTSVWCHTPDTPETPRRSESVFGLQSWRHKKLPWKLLEFIRVLFPLRGCLRRFEGLHMFWKVLGLSLRLLQNEVRGKMKAQDCYYMPTEHSW